MILEWDPTENVNVNLAADYTRSRNELNLGRPEAPLVSVNLLPGMPPTVLQPAPTTPWNNTVATSFKGNEGQQMDNWGTALTVGWQLNDAWLLKSITAYRSLEPDNYVDIDASIYELGDVFVGVDQDQTSQEFQLLYSSDRLEAVMGLYYFGEDIKSDQIAWADDFLKFGALPITFTRTVNDKLNTDSYAAFGQATWSFTDRFSGTVGLRYTDESKDYFRTTSTFYGAPLSSFNSTFVYKDDESWTALDADLRARLQADRRNAALRERDGGLQERWLQRPRQLGSRDGLVRSRVRLDVRNRREEHACRRQAATECGRVLQ